VLPDEPLVATAGLLPFALVRFVAGVCKFDPPLVLAFAVGHLGPPRQGDPLVEAMGPTKMACRRADH